MRLINVMSLDQGEFEIKDVLSFARMQFYDFTDVLTVRKGSTYD